MLVIVNPYHRSVTIDGEEVVQKILEFPNTLNHLSTISCTYDDEQKKITKVHDLHRFTSNFIQREYFFDNLPVFVDWYYAEKQAQIDEEARLQKYKEDVENAIEQTVQAGIDAQANIATDKTNAINAIESAHTTATNSITSKRAEALNAIQNSKAESLNTITETTNNSVSNVTGAMNTALNNISTERTSAVTAISNDKADALAAISTDRRTSLEEINTSINKATIQADRAKTEADRAKTYSDSMAAVVNVKPASKEEIGLVQIGDGIEVTETGIISVNLPKSAKATQDKEGNPVEAIAGVVTTNNTLTNTDGELGVNLGNTLEASEDGVINVKLGSSLKVSENGAIETNLELPKASDNIPQDLAEEASAGTDKDYARSDHTHKLPVVPIASDELPLPSAEEASVGVSNKYARADHSHPLQTSVSGNAGTATKLATARTINGVAFDGSENIEIPVGSDGTVSLKSTRSSTGNWTITGLDIGKPLHLICGGTATSWWGLAIKTVSGVSPAFSGTQIYTGAFDRSTVSGNSFIFIPNAESVTINIYTILDNSSIYAYQ